MIFDTATLAGGDTLAPPSGVIVTPDETVVSHRLQASIPIGSATERRLVAVVAVVLHTEPVAK